MVGEGQQVKKIVMQVTIDPAEHRVLSSDLRDVGSPRGRVRRLLHLATVGLMVEQGRFAVAVPGKPDAPGLPQESGSQAVSTPIAELLNWSDEP